QLTEDYEAIKENANRARYIRLEYQLERAIDDPSELVTLALTDPVFARYLDTIPYTGKDATGETIWTKIKDWIRSLAERIGIGKTQLDRLTDLLDDVYRRAGLLDEQGNFVSPGEYLNQAFGKQSKFLSEEEKRELVALHKLTKRKLILSDEVGAMPAPSIAITKSSIPYNKYGEITLIAKKETIDPKVTGWNRIFDADAWTATFPQPKYNINKKA